MAGNVLLAVLSVVALLTSAHGTNLSLNKQVKRNHPACSSPSDPFVNPTDCTTYYQCIGDGIVLVRPCPSGLHFNRKTAQCDYPESAKCEVSSSSDGAGTSANNDTPSGSSSLPECPYPADPNVVVHFPNPEDCSSFYKCGLDGEPVLIPCPAGLEWNDEADACDYPESAGCSVSSGGSISGGKPTGSSNTPPPECPFPADPVNVVQFPNPDNCSTFYKCSLEGEPVLIACPEGLEYNSEAQVCDYPASAGCSVSSGKSGSASKLTRSNTPPPECPFPADPVNVVQFPNPDNCSTFYKCSLEGEPVLIACPEGLEYNSEAQVCDYPASAGCSVSSGKSGSASKLTRSNTPPPECPFPADPVNVVQFPNPDNCSTFYKCSLEGEPVLIACPEGLEYNSEAQVCDYPASAGCSVSSGKSGSASKLTRSNTPPPECPFPADPVNVVQFPNPDNCSTFYKCSLEGEPVLIACPEGLEYNAEAQVCDYPASAGCSVSSGKSGSASKLTRRSNTPPPKCPFPADPVNVVQFPNPDNCSTFYKCSLEGEPVLIACPEGLEYNSEAQVCDYPASAGCSVSSGNSGSASKPAGTSNTPPPECPFPADPYVVVHFPNPDDCSSFYKCGLDGVPVLIPCPDGLEWNDEKDYCDYPESAGCSVSSGNSGSASQPAGTSNTPPPECPFPADPYVVVHFPNPDDCSSFYKCGLDGVPVLIPCPDGLEWNDEKDYCDYPESAGCSVSSDNSGSVGKPAGNSNTPPPECPSPADPDNVVQFPNPDDCSTFYKCDLDGNAVLQDCPPGLEYNAEAQVCDYRDSAGCSVAKK
ncbi:chondroitin proteoglycan-2-like isoform X2 [Schistocerca gregaria]|uniref:chondroitin proteoglycan-2-like isoform X2 n=1 Tax=Schistocerca gregaria TaxID=7010 RepID=UPI00211F3066|nr:chondroitin proteoglycan-2-like isoform X2 [Schistocerca gregaria]